MPLRTTAGRVSGVWCVGGNDENAYVGERLFLGDPRQRRSQGERPVHPRLDNGLECQDGVFTPAHLSPRRFDDGSPKEGHWNDTLGLDRLADLLPRADLKGSKDQDDQHG